MEEKVLREYLLKETEIAQRVIDRMGSNSFIIKGWAITLVVATLLIGSSSHYHYVAFLPWFMFWYLDAYFLRLEKLYRKLYGWLIGNRLTSQQFLLDMDKANLEKRFGKDVDCLPQVMFSKTLLAFYGLLLALIVASVLVDTLVI
jgi:hypothetical protein